ncbi:MAG: 23S rRNA (pseudouridine(1915)-N(3))-methyltransferase RlmH [Desulfobulbaceae bacterium]|nr:23S rRNA (pseudouridine(1915)-N(3))-methyltransferase RlmH [Desulfobulbaceae bacterium]
MKHEILFLGKTKDKFLRIGIEDFASRLKHYTNFDISVVKDSSGSRSDSKTIEKQGQLLLKSVPAGAFKVVLDAGGKDFSSESFSEQVTKWEMQGIKQVSYLIGGPDGHGPAVLKEADLKLSISRMTFTHDMVRLLLVEQLYRAYTIKAGERYHK